MILELSGKCGIVASFMILELSGKCGIVASFNHNTTLAGQFKNHERSHNTTPAEQF
jgi:hypothetical protein